METPEHLQIVEDIIKSLSNYNLGDIEKSRKQEMIIASFVLCCVLISVLSSYRFFNVRKHSDCLKFVGVIQEYFPEKYWAFGESLYNDLRSKLVHNYSVKGLFALSEGLRDYHLKSYKSKTIIDIDIFISDIKEALIQYIEDLHHKPEIRLRAIQHYKKYRIISHEEIDFSELLADNRFEEP